FRSRQALRCESPSADVWRDVVLDGSKLRVGQWQFTERRPCETRKVIGSWCVGSKQDPLHTQLTDPLDDTRSVCWRQVRRHRRHIEPEILRPGIGLRDGLDKYSKDFVEDRPLGAACPTHMS